MPIIENLQQSIKVEIDKFDALQRQLEDYIEEAQKQALSESDESELTVVDECDDKE